MRFVDVFCGAGGLSLGLHQEGFEPVLAVDSDEAAVNTFHRNFPSTRTCVSQTGELAPQLLKDIRDAADFLVLAGGPPCQDFSRLNRCPQSRSISGVRQYLYVVRTLQPDCVVFENVPRIRRSRVWPEFINALGKLGLSIWHDVMHLSESVCPNSGVDSLSSAVEASSSRLPSFIEGMLAPSETQSPIYRFTRAESRTTSR